MRRRARSYPEFWMFVADTMAKEWKPGIRAREKADKERPVGQVCEKCGKPRSRYARGKLCSVCENKEKS